MSHTLTIVKPIEEVLIKPPNTEFQINLWDLPKDKIYLNFKQDFHEEFFKKAIKYTGSQSKLAALLATSNEKFSYDMDIDQQRISFWVNKRLNIRLDVALYLANLIGISKEMIQHNVFLIKGVGTSIEIKNPKLPFMLTPAMANIIGKFICDGCILDARNHTTATYTNKSKILIKEFVEEIEEAFGQTKIGLTVVDSVIRARVTGLIGYLIINFFGYESGKKIPEIIKNSENEIKTAFLRAVFDDEGTIHKQNNQMRLKMKYPIFLKDVIFMLERFEIKTSKISVDKSDRFGGHMHYFVISGRENLQKFKESIGFTHPRKNHILEEHLNRPIKHIAYKPGETEKIICKLLEKTPMTAKAIGNEIERSKRTVQFFLSRLERKRAIQNYKIKRKYVYEYVWQIVK